MPGISAQLSGFFQKHGLIALAGESQRGIHTGNPAADHQRPLHHMDLVPIQGYGKPRLGHRHPDLLLGLFGGFFRLILVHPGILIADIGHFNQVSVQPGFL